MEEALGNKAGMITYYSSMSVGGFLVGVLKGWQLAGCMLAIAPVIGFSATLMGKLQSGQMHTSHVAYSQSAGYAE